MYIMLELAGSSTYLSTAGHPRLPELVHTIELPFGATDIRVTLTPQDITTQHIDQEIKPAARAPSSHPRISKYRCSVPRMKDEPVYAMTTPYPDNLVHHNSRGRVKQKQPACHLCHHSLLSDSIHTSNRDPSDRNHRRYHYYLYTTRHIPRSQQPAHMIWSLSHQNHLKKHFNHLLIIKTVMVLATYLKTTEDIYAEYDRC